MKTKHLSRSWFVSLLSAGAFALLLSCGLAREERALPKLNIQDTPISRATRDATSFAPVVKKVSPSVVNIYSTKIIRERMPRLPFFDDPLFRRFFGEPFGQDQPPRPRRAQNLGSGVIVSEDGYILTNNHVIEGADEIKVVLADGKREFTAKVVGTDPQTDVAVLKVDATGLPAAVIANSDLLEVGDTVLAIGNPFGVGQTVTRGIISATGRGGFNIVDYEDFIQTDASINPGNSGGALVDAEGRLVGIPTWIVSRSGGSQGIGFAVPINMARGVMERLLTDGKIKRGFLGVTIQSVTPELAREFKLPDQSGALISGVQPGTPAEKAGLREGDVIIEFNDRKVTDSRNLRLMVSQSAPGSRATLKYIRDGRTRTVTVTLGELPSDESGISGPTPDTEKAPPALEGVELRDIDGRARREYEIPANIRGALVVRVEPDSNAATAGLRPGDVIQEINRKPVRDVEEALEQAEQATGDRLLLRVWSKGPGAGGGSRFIVVEKAQKK